VGEADPDGIEVLARVRAVDPTVSRVAAVGWDERDTARPVLDAITMGQIDHWMTRPAHSPDEEFHQSITQFLGQWRTERGGGFEACRRDDLAAQPLLSIAARSSSQATNTKKPTCPASPGRRTPQFSYRMPRYGGRGRWGGGS
jgi:hypothetical protein